MERIIVLEKGTRSAASLNDDNDGDLFFSGVCRCNFGHAILVLLIGSTGRILEAVEDGFFFDSLAHRSPCHRGFNPMPNLSKPVMMDVYWAYERRDCARSMADMVFVRFDADEQHEVSRPGEVHWCGIPDP
jgi:hypothetical protein